MQVYGFMYGHQIPSHLQFSMEIEHKKLDHESDAADKLSSVQFIPVQLWIISWFQAASCCADGAGGVWVAVLLLDELLSSWTNIRLKCWINSVCSHQTITLPPPCFRLWIGNLQTESLPVISTSDRFDLPLADTTQSQWQEWMLFFLSSRLLVCWERLVFLLCLHFPTCPP